MRKQGIVGGVGLSPRVRGSRLARTRCVESSGSIPACAGEPRLAPTFRHIFTVYPRVCGGAVSGRTRKVNLAGLSPRVRGSPQLSELVTER